jgi:hypothetical protein
MVLTLAHVDVGTRTGDLRATEQHLEVLRETVAKEDKEPTKWKELSSSEKDAARASNKCRFKQSQLVPLAVVLLHLFCFVLFYFILFFIFRFLFSICFCIIFFELSECCFGAES